MVDRAEDEAAAMAGDGAMHRVEMPVGEVDRVVKPDRVVEARADEIARVFMGECCSLDKRAVGREDQGRFARAMTSRLKCCYAGFWSIPTYPCLCRTPTPKGEWLKAS